MRKLLIILFIVTSYSLLAQNKEHWLGMGVFDMVSPKLQYERVNKLNNVSLGLLFTNGVYGEVVDLPWYHYGPYVDMGLSWEQGDVLMTNKVGYEVLALFALARLSVVNYTNFQNNQVCLRPEIGLTLVSMMSITYGYNFDLGGHNSFGAKGHILSVNISYSISQW